MARPLICNATGVAQKLQNAEPSHHLALHSTQVRILLRWEGGGDGTAPSHHLGWVALSALAVLVAGLVFPV